jgi:photosystem II stability/assembly factor-like uncharacterized protein
LTTLVVLAAVTAVFTVGAQADEPYLDDLLGLERMGAWFDAHPEYKEMRSSGWKPYNRELWFQETRPAPPGASAALLRYQAFQVGKKRAAGGMGDPGWFCIGPVEYSGRCLTVDFHPTDPSIVYVGSATGGLWKSTDGGDTWMTSTDDLPTLAIGAVCVLPWDPNIVLIGTGEGNGAGYVSAGKGIFGMGVLKSTDAGATWNLTSLNYTIPSGHGFNVIEDNPTTRTILAGANDGLWRSTDDGDTWVQVASNGNFFDVKWKPGDPNRVYVAKGKDPFLNFQSDNGVFISTNDGLTFALAGAGQPAGSLIAKTKIAVTNADPNVIYAHYVNSTNYQTLGVYRSTDGGLTWQDRNTTLNMCGGQGWYNNVIAVDQNNTNRLVAGGNILYTSNNGGTTFNDLNGSIPFGNEIAPHWDNHALAYEPGSNSTLWIATDGGPWRSTDDGAIWTGRRAGIISYQFYDIGVAQSDPLFIMGGTQDNGMPGREDEDSWFHSTFIADGFVCNIDPANAKIVYSEWQFGNHIKSTNGGQTWSSIQSGIFGNGSWLTPVDQDQTLESASGNGEHLYTSTSAGIFRTTNGGTLWQHVGSQNARWISMNPSDGNVVWTVSNNVGVWHTTDDGDTWTRSAAFPGNGLETKIHADPSDVASAFVTYGGYSTDGPHLVRTMDFGTTWADVTGDFPDQPANTFIVDPARPGDWYIGSDVGVWKSSDGGAHWMPFGTGLANAFIADLEIRRDARKLVAGTYGRGVWEIDLAGLSSVGESRLASRNLMLDQPYPNPVAGETVFRFAARSSEPVELGIYDVQGRRVGIVARDINGDGVIRMAKWSARALPDGVYLAILRAGDQQISRKVLVIR